MGGVFRLPIVAGVLLEPLLALLDERDVLSAGLSVRAHDELRALPVRPTALFFGAEGSGLDDALERSLDRLVRIPMTGDVDSLGVAAAAAVALYAYRTRPHDRASG